MCRHCSGLNTVESLSSTGYNIFGITIPRDACSKCIDDGHKYTRILHRVDIQTYIFKIGSMMSF